MYLGAFKRAQRVDAFAYKVCLQRRRRSRASPLYRSLLKRRLARSAPRRDVQGTASPEAKVQHG